MLGQPIRERRSVDFEFAMSQKGYKHLRTLSTKKKLCDRYGLQYRKSGRDVVFHNLLEKIPDKC